MAVGLSHAKTAYLRSLAEYVLAGELELDRLEQLSDDEVAAELVAVKGIGEWSAHIFLMFTLGRPDIARRRRPRHPPRHRARLRTARRCRRPPR